MSILKFVNIHRRHVFVKLKYCFKKNLKIRFLFFFFLQEKLESQCHPSFVALNKRVFTINLSQQNVRKGPPPSTRQHQPHPTDLRCHLLKSYPLPNTMGNTTSTTHLFLVLIQKGLLPLPNFHFSYSVHALPWDTVVYRHTSTTILNSRSPRVYVPLTMQVNEVYMPRKAFYKSNVTV